jgi:hypothetical protein
MSKPSLAAWWLAVACGASGCMMGLTSSGDSSNEAARCGQGVDLFEHSRCTNVMPTPGLAPTVGVEFQQLDHDCRDATSQQRLRRLETTCVAGYQHSVADRQAAHDDVRARYQSQVAELRADPAYQPQLDRWVAARDHAQIAETAWNERRRDPDSDAYYRVFEAKKAELDEQSAAMRALLQKHGIDPKDSHVLGVW